MTHQFRHSSDGVRPVWWVSGVRRRLSVVLVCAALAVALGSGPAQAVVPAKPVVTSIVPASGSTAGRTVVTITGRNLTGASKATFSGTAGTGLIVVSATQVKVTSPAHVAGLVNVQVITRGGTSAVVAAGRFTYATPPTVSAISPAGGSTAGHTVVTITGKNLIGAGKATFGGTAGTGLIVVSATQVKVTSPAHVAGPVNVQLTTRGGTSAAVAADRFTYATPPAKPTITAISPAGGSTTGGTVVTITGKYLIGASKAAFGGTAGTRLSVLSATQVKVTSPLHAPGSVDVQVTTPGGTSVAIAADKFSYVAESAMAWSGSTRIVSRHGDPSAISCPSRLFCAGADEYGNVLLSDGVNWGEPRPLVPDPLHSVSCPSANFCIAVGDAGQIVSFNGTMWSTHASVESGARLLSVSCPTSTFCVAVGWNNGSIAVKYDGTAWSGPTQLSSEMVGNVSCPTTTFCLALTYDDFQTKATSHRFDGTVWGAPQAMSLAPGKLTCVSSTFCMAVGTDFGAVYDGTSWAKSGVIAGSPDLQSVSCSTSTSCVAVGAKWSDQGAADGGTWAKFNGTSWTAATFVPLRAAYLRDVSCPFTDFCLSIGSDGEVIRFDGSTWTAAPAADVGNALTPVVCPTSTFCLALTQTGYAQIFDGSVWSEPDPVTNSNHDITSVACSSAGYCVAIGSTGATVVMTAKVWTNVAFGPSGLNRISCPSENFCVATAQDGNAYIFNGKVWGPPTPVNSRSDDATYLSCPTAKFCAAINDYGDTATFNGTAWTQTQALGLDAWSSVSCTSAAFCVAVSDFGHYSTFDGTSWSNRAWFGDNVDSVSCSSSSFCAAVSWQDNSVFFNGYSWSARVPVPSVSYLASVSCPTAKFCMATDRVGNGFVGSAR